MAKIGIVGAAGYTGGELLRILVHHPDVHLTCIMSNSQAGKLVSDVHTDLLGSTNARFSADLSPVDVLFLCSGHGESKKFRSVNDIPWHTKIVYLSTDFRDESEGFVVGLAEFQMGKSSRPLKSPTQAALQPPSN